MPILEVGTQPPSANTGNLILTSVVSVSPVATVTTANSVSTTGVFTYSNTRSVLSPTVSVNVSAKVTVANSFSTTGVFTYSNTRTILSGVTGLSFTQPGTGPQVTAPAPTRQLLIR